MPFNDRGELVIDGVVMGKPVTPVQTAPVQPAPVNPLAQFEPTESSSLLTNAPLWVKAAATAFPQAGANLTAGLKAWMPNAQPWLDRFEANTTNPQYQDQFGVQPMGALAKLLNQSQAVPKTEDVLSRVTKAQQEYAGSFDPKIYQDIDQAQKSGSLLDKLSVAVGGGLPMMAQGFIQDALGSAVGSALGAPVGAAAGAAIAAPTGETAAPATVPGGAAIGSLLGGAAGRLVANQIGFTPTESGNFSNQLMDLGIDDDILDSKARSYGMEAAVPNSILSALAGGTIRGMAGMKPAFSMLAKAGLEKVAGVAEKAAPSLGKDILKFIGKEQAANAGAGAAMAATSLIFNANLDDAVRLQNERNLSLGKPQIDQKQVDALKQNWAESAGMGYGLSTVMRGAGIVGSKVKQVGGNIIDVRKTSALNKLTADTAAARMDEIFKADRGTLLPGHVGDVELRNAQSKPLTNEQRNQIIDQAPLAVDESGTVGLVNGEVVKVPKRQSTLIDMAESLNKIVHESAKIDLHQSEADLRQAIKNVSGLLSEGPALTGSKYGDLSKVPYSKAGQYESVPVEAPKTEPAKAAPAKSKLPRPEDVMPRTDWSGKSDADLRNYLVDFVPAYMLARASREQLLALVDMPTADLHDAVNNLRLPPRGAKPVTPETPKTARRPYTGPTLVDLAKAEGISWKRADGTAKTPADVRKELEAITSVEYRPVVDRAQRADTSRGRTAEALAKMLTSSMPSREKMWFDKLNRALKSEADANEYSALETEAKALGIPDEAVTEAVAKIRAKDYSGYTDMPTQLAQPEAEVNRIDLLHSALAPVLGDKTAAAVLRDGKPLHEVLTRKQYNEYVQNLRGSVKAGLREFFGEQAAIRGEVRMEAPPLAAHVMPDGTRFQSNLAAEVVDGKPISSMRRWAALVPSLDQLTRMTGHAWHNIDDAMYSRHKAELKALAAHATRVQGYWKAVPKELRSGLASERLAILANWLNNDATGRAYIEHDELGLLPDHGKSAAEIQKMLVKRINDSLSSKESEAKILYNANWIKENDRKTWDWWGESGVITPLQFRDKYVPLLRLFKEKGGGLELNEFLSRNKSNPLVSRLSTHEIKSLADLVDVTKSLHEDLTPIPGQPTPFMQHAREANTHFIEQVSTIKDTRLLMDLYARKAIRKILFQDTVPFMNWLMKDLAKQSKGWDETQRDTVNTVVGGYLTSILGVPGSTAKLLKSWNWYSPLNVVSKNVNKMTESLRDNPLFNSIPGLNWLVKEHNTAHFKSAGDALSDAMEFMYATTLGVPANMMAPIGNIIGQLPMAAQSLGAEALFRGLKKVLEMDPATIKAIRDLDLRPDMTMMDNPRMSPLLSQKRLSSIYKAMMLPFATSDAMAVYGTAAGALDRWQPVHDAHASGALAKMNDEQVLNLLGGVKSIDKATSMAVGNGVSPLSKKVFDGHISKPLAVEVLERIRAGKMDEARRLWVQWNVNFSQWRYGAGGSPLVYSGPLAKALLMYKSWTMNYFDFMAQTSRRVMSDAYKGGGSSNFHRALQVGGMWLVAAATLSAMGVPAKKIGGWIGAGPVGGLLSSGPISNYLIGTGKLLTGGWNVASAEALGDDAEKREAMEWLKRDWETQTKGMKRVFPVDL